jgi:hypothetical protein
VLLKKRIKPAPLYGNLLVQFRFRKAFAHESDSSAA